MNHRHWKASDDSFHDTRAQHLYDAGVLCELESREPWFISAAHDESCLANSLAGFEAAVDRTLESLGRSVGAASNTG